MKTVKCWYCKNVREVEDDIVMAICKCCQVDMRVVKDGKTN